MKKEKWDKAGNILTGWSETASELLSKNLAELMWILSGVYAA